MNKPVSQHWHHDGSNWVTDEENGSHYDAVRIQNSHTIVLIIISFGSAGFWFRAAICGRREERVRVRGDGSLLQIDGECNPLVMI
jgi:hypothetical protein